MTSLNGSCGSVLSKQVGELKWEQKARWKWGTAAGQQPLVPSTALQMPSTEADNNVRHVERCSSSAELTAQLRKGTGGGRIHPENDPLAATQTWMNPFWSAPTATE